MCVGCVTGLRAVKSELYPPHTCNLLGSCSGMKNVQVSAVTHTGRPVMMPTVMADWRFGMGLPGVSPVLVGDPEAET